MNVVATVLAVPVHMSGIDTKLSSKNNMSCLKQLNSLCSLTVSGQDNTVCCVKLLYL